MAAQSIVQILLRAAGGRQVATETGAAAKGLTGLRSAAVGANAAALSVGRTLSNDVSRGMRAVTTTAKYAAGGLALVGLAATKMGLDFNSSMEQNEVAFKHFLGNSQRAKQYMADLFDIAAHTPFETTQIADAAKRLLAFGFAAEDAKGVLVDLGDAASGLGTGAEGIDRMVLALGQMKSTGVIQGDELRQLQEAGINVNKYLIRAGVITRSDIGQIGNLHIRSAKAIKAIRAGIQREFGGLSEDQGKTFAGQISTLRDYTSRTLGTVTEPLFVNLRDKVLPALSDTAEEINDIFGQKGLTNPEKFAKAWKVTRRELGPFVDSVEQGLKDAHLDQRLADVVEWAAPKMAEGAAHAGGKAVGAFAKAWWQMGPWGKLITVGMLAKHFGVFALLGRTAAYRLAGSFGTNVGPALGKQKTVMRPGLTAFGTWMGRLVGPVAAFFIAREIAKTVPALAQYSGSKGFGELSRDLADYLPGEDSEAHRARMRAYHTQPPAGEHPTHVTTRRVISGQPSQRSRMRAAAHATGVIQATLPVTVKVGEKVLTEVVAKQQVRVRDTDRHGG